MAMENRKQWTMIPFGILAFAATEAIAFFSMPRALVNFASTDITPEEALATFVSLLFVFFAFLVLLRYFRESNLLGFFFFISLVFGLYFIWAL